MDAALSTHNSDTPTRNDQNQPLCGGTLEQCHTTDVRSNQPAIQIHQKCVHGYPIKLKRSIQ